MRQAGSASVIVTPTRRRSGVRQGAAWLPVVGLIAMIAFTFTGGFHFGGRPRPPTKYLVLQEKIAPPPQPAATRERHHDKPVPLALRRGDTTLVPVASADGPDVTAGGTIRIAASLIDSGAAPTRIAQAKTSESPGTPSRTSPAHPEQMASLTPAEPSRAAMPAWLAYGQPFDAADKSPRLALIVAGADDDMDRAIATLPAAVTLALDPYGRRLPVWIELARAKGHEVLLTLSAPPIKRGQRDAGPMAILSSLDPKENLERLDWALDRATGFVGVVDIVGNRPAAEAGPILAKLGEHGMMLVSGTEVRGRSAAVPLTAGDAVLSPNLSRRELDEKLAALQDKARHDGHAVGIAVVDPALLRHLAAWLASLERQSIALAPATAMIAARPDSGIAAK